jgi:hypothetical protein
MTPFTTYLYALERHEESIRPEGVSEEFLAELTDLLNRWASKEMK